MKYFMKSWRNLGEEIKKTCVRYMKIPFCRFVSRSLKLGSHLSHRCVSSRVALVRKKSDIRSHRGRVASKCHHDPVGKCVDSRWSLNFACRAVSHPFSHNMLRFRWRFAVATKINHIFNLPGNVAPALDVVPRSLRFLKKLLSSCRRLCASPCEPHIPFGTLLGAMEAKM